MATTVNAVWRMGFISDSLSTAWRIKCLTVADDLNHECVSIAVDWGISGQYVMRLLDQAAVFRGYPRAYRQRTGVHEPRIHGLGQHAARALIDGAGHRSSPRPTATGTRHAIPVEAGRCL